MDIIQTIDERPAGRATAIRPGGCVEGTPKTILRVEGAGALMGATFAYAHVGGGWLVFALLFLMPDVSMLGYLVNRRLGAAIYNFGHSYLTPASLVGIGLLASQPWALSGGLIWIAHIGFDRLVGYGLKYRSDFKHTHLGTPFEERTGAAS